MIHTAEIDLEQLGNSDPPVIDFDVFSYWVNNGYPIDGIVEAHSIVNQKPEEDNTGHIVLKVETLSKPVDRADAVKDSIVKYACDCKGYQFHYSVDLEEQRLPEWGSCKHIKAVDKTLKAEQDSNQVELIE